MTVMVTTNCWKCGVVVQTSPTGLNCEHCPEYSVEQERKLVATLRRMQFEEAEAIAGRITKERHVPDWLLLLILLGLLTILGDALYEAIKGINRK